MQEKLEKSYTNRKRVKLMHKKNALIKYVRSKVFWLARPPAVFGLIHEVCLGRPGTYYISVQFPVSGLYFERSFQQFEVTVQNNQLSRVLKFKSDFFFLNTPLV